MTHPFKTPHEYRRAFSLIELVIVVVILGFIAAIAVPRLSSAAEKSVISNVRANITALDKAIAHYAAEHDDHTPAHEANGNVNPDEATFAKRLVQTSNILGDTGANLVFGPYLRDIPFNSINGRRRIRIDGAPAGANTHGWRFNSSTRIIEPDDAYGVLVLSGGSESFSVSKPGAGADAAAELGASGK